MRIRLLGLAALVIAASCSKPAAREQLAGEWKMDGSMNAEYRAKTPDWKEVMKTIHSMTYSIQKDGRYTLWMPGARLSGTVSVAGDIVTFTPDSVNDKPLAEVRDAYYQRAAAGPDPKESRRLLDVMFSSERMRIRKGGNHLDSFEPDDLKDGKFYLERTVKI